MMCRGWLVSSHSNRCEWMAELRGKSSWWSFCLSCRQSSRYDLSLETKISKVRWTSWKKKNISVTFWGCSTVLRVPVPYGLTDENSYVCAESLRFRPSVHMGISRPWVSWVNPAVFNAVGQEEGAFPLCCVCRTWNIPLKQPLLVWMYWVGNPITGMELRLAKC